MKVLIAEDSIAVLEATAELVRDAGYEVITAVDGPSALDEFKKHSPDLTLLDVIMPGMSGYEVATEIRTYQGDDWTPIVFLSGKVDDKSIIEGIHAGGDDYLTKPVSSEVLLAKLTAMERLAQMRRKLISTQKELEEKNNLLQLLSNQDALTQIGNRRYFDDGMERENQRAAREAKNLSVLILDVDHFKQFNDHFGHQAGDDCLIRIAEVFKRVFKRPGDIFARYGGEEFAAVLPDTDEDGAVKLGSELRTVIARENIHHPESSVGSYVTVSVGCASSTVDHRLGIEALLHHADDALYVSKERGRDCVTRASKIPRYKI